MATLAPLHTRNLLNCSMIKHGFFTRQGGVSRGLYNSLNVGFGKNDALQDVKQNHERIAHYFNTPSERLATLKQVHGNQIVEVESSSSFGTVEADGFITNNPDVILGVMTADCVPLLFYAPDCNYIAAVHGGRESIKKGILENVLHLLNKKGADNSRLVVGIGPAIAQLSYEVGPEIYDAFINADPMFAAFFITIAVKNKFYMDLPGLCVMQLKEKGVINIENITRNTYAEENLFFSCRRALHLQQPTFGNQLSAIKLA